MSPKWFKSWFDSEYYHLLYDGRDEYEARAFVARLTQDLRIPKSAKILDAACGRGRHARNLSELGYSVDGYDLSDNSISFAKDYETERLHFYVHDLREVFRPNYYDLVLNLFTSFGYFEDPNDDYLVFESLIANAKKDGLLVVDFLNAERVVENLNTDVLEQDKQSVVYRTQKRIDGDAVVKNISFYDRDNGEEGEFSERVKLLRLEDFRNFARMANADLIQIFGSYDLESFDPKSSDRLIMVFRK